MAKFTPQLDLYSRIEKLKKTTSILFWIIFFLTLLVIGLKKIRPEWHLDEFLDVINIIAILLFFTFDYAIDYVLIPQAETKRRDDFIDNSFASKFSTQNSLDYFSNDELRHGTYKAAVNLFESCFFTYSLLKLLTRKKIILPAVLFTIIFVMAYYGFKEVSFALSVLQLLFSANILGTFIRHLILLNRLSVIYDDWIKMFNYVDQNNFDNSYVPLMLRNWLGYETLVSRIPPDIPNSFFKKHNDRLSQEWESIALKYNIKPNKK